MAADARQEATAAAPGRRVGRRATLALLGLAPLLSSAARPQTGADPLPSWRDVPRKRAVPPDRRGLAPLSIGLGVGFVPGGNCDIAIETG
jgi:hypothetical protein